MTIIHSIDEIPAFASEAEEADFWATHALGDELWDQLSTTPDDQLPPARARTRPVGIRFDESTLQRIKDLAARRQQGYQSLIREFIAERLYEEEVREGIVKRVRRSAPGGGGPSRASAV